MIATLPIVEGRGIAKSFSQPNGREIEVIAPTDLSIYPDQVVALLGPSGSGKSTLLRILTGLVTPSAGQVLWSGMPLDDHKPNVGIVFQNFALFPWLTVLENVETPLQARGMGSVERRKRALKILDMVGLDGFETAYPKELSGGMKQRVGFARALVIEPDVLFMDEPFSALDVLTAENLRSELLELWLSRKMPTRGIFFVTHNIEEAVFLADRVIVLGRNPGRIRTDFDVKLSQPRDRKSESFVEVVDYVYKVLTEPEIEHAPPATDSKLVAQAERARIKYQMLPHASPSGMVGLLEVLIDRGGRDDLYHLADDLVMEVDDLLPIVEAAALLKFVHLHEGDLEISPEGRAFAEADVLAQKVLFQKAAVANVPLLRQMGSMLHSKSNRTMPAGFFLDILDEHFTEKEARRQLETTISWGRFAEIFDYDADGDRLVLPEG